MNQPTTAPSDIRQTKFKPHQIQVSQANESPDDY